MRAGRPMRNVQKPVRFLSVRFHPSHVHRREWSDFRERGKETPARQVPLNGRLTPLKLCYSFSWGGQIAP